MAMMVMQMMMARKGQGRGKKMKRERLPNLVRFPSAPKAARLQGAARLGKHLFDLATDVGQLIADFLQQELRRGAGGKKDIIKMIPARKMKTSEKGGKGEGKMQPG